MSSNSPKNTTSDSGHLKKLHSQHESSTSIQSTKTGHSNQSYVRHGTNRRPSVIPNISQIKPSDSLRRGSCGADILQQLHSARDQSQHGQGSASAGAVPPQHLQLSPSDTALITKSWAVIEHDRLHVGRLVFKSVLMDAPEVIGIFDFGANISSTSSVNEKRLEQQLANDKQFQEHAFRFMQVFDSVVRSLTEPAVGIQAILRNLGHQHERKRSQGFRPVYWSIFTQHLLAVFIEKSGMSGDRPALERAWSCVISFVIAHMKHGYTHGIASASAQALRRSVQLTESPQMQQQHDEKAGSSRRGSSVDSLEARQRPRRHTTNAADLETICVQSKGKLTKL